MLQAAKINAGHAMRVGVVGAGVMGANHARVLSEFPGVELFPIDPSEPNAANILKAGDDYIYSPAFPRTAARLQRSLPLNFIDMSELAKAEGALTCCSIVFRDMDA